MIFCVFLSFIIEGILCYVFGMSNATDEMCEIVSLILLFINFLILFIYIAKRYKGYSRIVGFAMVLSLVMKCFLVLWDYYGTGVFILPNSHSDSESFHNQAIYYAQGLYSIVENYSYIIGIIYYLFGIQRITAQFFNIILSFAGIDLLDKILIELGINGKAKNVTLFFAALLPNYLIMSSILIRECLISFIICVSLFFYIKWWKNNNYFYFALAILISLIACYFHSGAIAVTMGYSASLVLTRKEFDNDRSIKIDYKSIILTTLMISLFLYLFNALSGSLLKRFGGLQINTIEKYIDEHNIYSDKSNGNTSTYTAGFSGLGGLLGLIINSPIRMFYFLWVPMIWSIRGVSDIIAFIGSSCFYGGTVSCSLIYVFKNKIQETNKFLFLIILIVALCCSLVFSWGVDSAGSALRHREKFYYIYLLLLSLYVDIKSKQKNE